MDLLSCFGCCAWTEENDETNEFGILDGAGDIRGNFSELVLGSNRRPTPRHVTGSVSVCGCDQTGYEVDVIDWEETQSERSFQNKLALARQGVIALRSQSAEEKTTDDVSSTKIRQQLANIDKVEDMINGQIKKAAVMREQMQLTKARLKQWQDQTQEGQNGSRPDGAEETRKEHETRGERDRVGS
ncbi:uncharacterized protein LOC134070576 isoform X2 [Sardina pilchardus]|uniref:uncharacterized protein LOC134070576 isoform X2 n=1 Tax=Sardina pilchardus TaxID=27697 RepID=UPI002E14B04B